MEAIQPSAKNPTKMMAAEGQKQATKIGDHLGKGSGRTAHADGRGEPFDVSRCLERHRCGKHCGSRDSPDSRATIAAVLSMCPRAFAATYLAGCSAAFV